MTTEASAAAVDAKRIPKLRGDLRLYLSGQDRPGAESWTLFDPVSDRYFKLHDNDHALLSKLDRAQTQDELLSRLKSSGMRIEWPEVFKSIAFLHSNGLLELDGGADDALAAKRGRIKDAMLSKWLLSAYLFLDIPLFRPDAFFSWSAPLVLKLFNKWSQGALAALSLLGYASLLPRAEALSSFFWNSLDFQGLAGYMLAILAIKAIHECAHAYAAKANGVRVRRMGLAFIVFIPRLYTDITDAWRLPKRSRRAMIDGAGIAAELLIGGFAAMLWSRSAPGPLNTVAYYVFAVSAISTVFINGNPFIKYDGYYLLMDLTGIDNLYAKGIALVRRNFRLWAFGLKSPEGAESPSISGWRTPFMACFAAASILYRLFLYTSIILIVYLQFTKVLGMALFALEAYLLIIRPLIAECKDIYRYRAMAKRSSVAISAGVLALALLVIFLPFPWNVSMQGESRPARAQTLYAKTDGFLVSLEAEDGQSLKAGQTVFVQSNPFLEWSLKENDLQAKSAELELDQMRSDKKRLGGQEVQSRRMEKAKESAEEIGRRLSTLSVKAELDGVLSIADRRLKPGKWLSAGESIGELFDPASTEIAAYAGESDVAGIRPGDKASIRLQGSLEKFRGRLVSVNEIPSKSPDSLSTLLDIAGGPLQTVRDPEDQSLRLKSPLYMVRIALDNPGAVPVGRSGLVKVTKMQSLGAKAARDTLSALQREFSF